MIKENEFLKHLFESFQEKNLSCSCIAFRNLNDKTDPPNLKKFLNLNKNISNTAESLLNLLEENEKIDNSFIDFKWKLLSFMVIQDIFEIEIKIESDKNILDNIWYFYYESKFILIESILCWLNGFVSSQGALMRLFLEFSLLQNFLYRKNKDGKSDRFLENFFKDGIVPSKSNLFTYCLPNNSISSSIRKRIQLNFNSLSQNCNHPYKPGLSQTHSGSFLPGLTMERIYGYKLIDVILTTILWIYYINFPMLFYPINILKKFGFSGPVGLFIDDNGGGIIKKSLSKEDYSFFKTLSQNNVNVNDSLEYINNLKDLTKDQIIKTWNSKQKMPSDILDAYYVSLAEIRALKEFTSLNVPSSYIGENIDHSLYERIQSLSEWKKIYKTF